MADARLSAAACLANRRGFHLLLRAARLSSRLDRGRSALDHAARADGYVDQAHDAALAFDLGLDVFVGVAGGER